MPRTPAGRLRAVRAVLFGRPLSTHEEITERLSKTKALAIFSSDPISSSAYATEEILRVLVLAGAGALFLSLPVAAGVAFLLAAVAISYRQIVHAYPSGGGDYAVARRNLPLLGSLVVAGRAARRLRDDRRRVDRVRRRAGHLRGPRAPRLEARHRRRCDPADHDRQPARAARVREHLRDPDVPLRRFGARDDRDRRLPGRRQRRGRRAGARGPGRSGSPVGRRDLPPDQGVRIGLRRADRDGGDRQRRAGVQAAGIEERGHDARRRRDPACVPLPGHHLRGVVLRRPADGRGRGPEDRHQPGRGRDLRRRDAPVLPVPDVHGADPLPRREHVLQRVPAPRRDPRDGRLHASPVQLPRRSAGVHLGRPDPERRRRRASARRSTARRMPSSRCTRSGCSSPSPSASPG